MGTTSGENNDDEISRYAGMDEKTRDFIGENYTFFKKRDQVYEALLKIEKMNFYQSHIRKYIEDKKFNPEMVVYNTKNNQAKNYQYASFPALALVNVLDPEILSSDSQVDELEFVQFMRQFTEKVYKKAQELNQTFHHQYKHTLSELTLYAMEKLDLLNEEIAFLENPDNREKAYTHLLDKIKGIYNKQLENKIESIENLKKEMEEVKAQHDQNKADLEKLLKQKIPESELQSVLTTMPNRLANLK